MLLVELFYSEDLMSFRAQVWCIAEVSMGMAEHEKLLSLLPQNLLDLTDLTLDFS